MDAADPASQAGPKFSLFKRKSRTEEAEETETSTVSSLPSFTPVVITKEIPDETSSGGLMLQRPAPLSILHKPSILITDPQ
jgi:hypothetical protein